jgi:hypothetical protein
LGECRQTKDREGQPDDVAERYANAESHCFFQTAAQNPGHDGGNARPR